MSAVPGGRSHSQERSNSWVNIANESTLFSFAEFIGLALKQLCSGQDILMVLLKVD